MFDKLDGYVWLDSKLVEWQEAKVHVLTHSLHYASSIFEGLRVYNGKIFKAEEHYERFQKSAELLDYKLPYSVRELIEATEETLKANKLDNAYIRALAWCGSKVMTVSNRLSDIRVSIAAWDRPVVFPETYFSEGIKMDIATWRRPHPSTMPTASKAASLYVVSSISKSRSEKLGFTDSLMLSYDGRIAEATSSNIFMVIDGTLYTPTPDCFLNGITRLTCLELAKELNIKTVEQSMPLDMLNEATEVFLTGTAIEILPVGSIEGLGKKWLFKPADITNKLIKAFKEKVYE